MIDTYTNLLRPPVQWAAEGIEQLESRLLYAVNRKGQKVLWKEKEHSVQEAVHTSVSFIHPVSHSFIHPLLISFLLCIFLINK